MIKRTLLFLLATTFAVKLPGWGFYAHRMINRLAVFSLPPEMFGFYKKHIEYLTEHAVDPDKRRYSDPEEAARHYIDLDYYECTAPVDSVPLFWKDAVAKYTEDTLLAYGIVPWYISLMKYKLTEAFKEKNTQKILKLSAEIGHYIGDAHVPLHATMNYNGQLTGQHGIHGLWESRLPELFSDGYDFFTGRAVYVDQVQMLAWAASESSFAAKDSVLLLERELNQRTGSDVKYSIETRGQSQVKVYARQYSETYHHLLNGQVERRLRASIAAVGSVWYTAWVDAGQPVLDDLEPGNVPGTEEKKAAAIEEQRLLNEQKMIGRGE